MHRVAELLRQLLRGVVAAELPIFVHRARDHADRNYSEPLDLAALAAISGISKYHFQRLFVATYGVSPAEHLSRRRIERAQDLLRATNPTATEIYTDVDGVFHTEWAAERTEHEA